MKNTMPKYSGAGQIDKRRRAMQGDLRLNLVFLNALFNTTFIRNKLLFVLYSCLNFLVYALLQVISVCPINLSMTLTQRIRTLYCDRLQVSSETPLWHLSRLWLIISRQRELKANFTVFIYHSKMSPEIRYFTCCSRV